MILDSHVHVDMYSQLMLKKALKQCDEYDFKMLGVSMCISSYKKLLSIAENNICVIPSFGIHPWKADIYCNKLDILDDYLSKNKYIGEIGLDKRFLNYAAPFEDQIKVFEYILSNHATKDKLVNLHTSGAEVDVYKMLRKHNCSRPLIHWYNGDVDLIADYLSIGSYFSIGVEILFSKKIQHIVKILPLERILLETDNPSSYSWLKGKESDDGMPELLLRVLDKICEVKNTTKDILISSLEINQKNILA